jgi:hypothetical protein
MRRILEGLPDRLAVCYGASCDYGHYHDLLRPLASRVLVAHSGQLRLIVDLKELGQRAVGVQVNDFPVHSTVWPWPGLALF